MIALETTKIVCRQCFALLDEGDNFCRRCGASATAAPESDRPHPAPGSLGPVLAQLVGGPSARRGQWTHHPWFVLTLLLSVGPLGLPVLWRSREFSRTWKAALSVLVVALTALLVWQVWYFMFKALEPLRELQKLRRL
jgi:hypothetical protein